MTTIKRLIAFISAVIFAGGVVFARPLTDSEHRQLADTVAAFNAGTRDADYSIVTKTIPPKVVAYLASTAGIEVEALNKLMIEQLTTALAGIKLESFSMDLANALQRELPTGEPYVLIPTVTIMDAGETGRFRATSQTLALLDEGAWYLLRVNDAQQVVIMRQVYPQFIGVEFDGGSVEALK
ncbi:hypothetical protein [Mesorhizobium sp. CN2-181]|uniref:hypothetical protein n=1 Tax=Mesorhizobium yinganensis TaxID=3157707 RepID=UPI0032B71EAD